MVVVESFESVFQFVRGLLGVSGLQALSRVGASKTRTQRMSPSPSVRSRGCPTVCGRDPTRPRAPGQTR